MQNIFCLLNHNLTKNQIDQLEKEFGSVSILYPNAELKFLWSNLPTDGNISPLVLKDVIKWLNEKKVKKGDVFILQGEFGHSFALIDYALQNGLIPIHSVTKRIAEESCNGETVTRKYIFKHICFRKYKYYDECK